MKNPLTYQTTEYDCGPTTLINAISYLFNREEIPPDVVKAIMLYCLDGYNKQGEAGKSGTTAMAMLFLSNWFNQFGKIKKFPIYSEVMKAEDVYIDINSKIAVCLQQGGAVVARLMLGGWHYVLMTDIDDEYVYLFDPYYRTVPFRKKGVEIIYDQPLKANRKVRHEHFNSIGKGYYALGPYNVREAMLIYNNNTRKTIDTIEYII